MGRTCFDGTVPREEVSESWHLEIPAKQRGSTATLPVHALSNKVGVLYLYCHVGCQLCCPLLSPVEVILYEI